MAQHAFPTPSLHPRSSNIGAVVIAASAGGIPALFQLLGSLPGDFPLPILVTQHLSRSSPSCLPQVLEWRMKLRAKWVEDGEPFAADGVHVVRPGKCVRIGRSFKFSVSDLPSNSRSWLDSVDVLLASVAEQYGESTIAVVLSGMMAVGIDGLRLLRAKGATVMAQNRASSEFFDMPLAAVDLGKVEVVYAPNGIAEALMALADQRVTEVSDHPI